MNEKKNVYTIVKREHSPDIWVKIGTASTEGEAIKIKLDSMPLGDLVLLPDRSAEGYKAPKEDCHCSKCSE